MVTETMRLPDDTSYIVCAHIAKSKLGVVQHSGNVSTWQVDS